jgi:outer membrane protein OmpA-like peptidoglycan-associated protein
MSEKELLNFNTHLIQEGFLVQGEMVVDKLLTIQPDNPNYNYRKGYLELEIRKNYSSAIPYFLKAITDTKPHFDAFNTNEKSAPADTYFHLGRCYHLNNQIDEAEKMYNEFIIRSYSKSDLIPIANRYLEQCKVARLAFNTPVDVAVKNIGTKVNTLNPEYSPVISLDGSALYFTSRRPWPNERTDAYRSVENGQYPEDVYVSYMDFDSSWTEALRLEFCLPNRNEATISVSADERRLYLYEDSTGSGDIYSSDFYGAKFNDIQLMNEPGLNTPYWETHCFVNREQTKMIFSSDRPGGFGERDLYVSEKKDGKTWSEPINLGPEINSAQDEDSPFWSVDGKRLYFSSNSNKSMGGFDVFYCDLKSDGNWDLPKNAGYPFNSTNDDLFYTTTIDGTRGYLTSFRKDGFGEKDIYEVYAPALEVKNLAVLKGLIRTKDGSPLPENFPVSMVLKCTDCKEGVTEKIIFPRLRDRIFVSDLLPCHTYNLTYVNAEDKLNMYSSDFSTACQDNFQEIKKEVILDVEHKLILPNLKYTMNGLVADKATGLPIINSRVDVYLKGTKTIVETAYTDNSGVFALSILKDGFYGDTLLLDIRAGANGYLSNVDEKTLILDDSSNVQLKYELNRATIGTDIASMFDIKPIYFDFDKSTIRKDAMVELDKVVKIMNENPTLEIEYGSHTDCRGSEAYNKALSDRRAKSSAAYIKARITNPNRIHGKGYGESMLVNECECEGKQVTQCTEEQHQANRRTEFRIVKN